MCDVRFHHRRSGPSCGGLPRPCWLQRGRCPESWLWLPLGHSIHHLCAATPVSSSSLCHGLPSPLRLLSLPENHISEGSGEELYPRLSVTRQKSNTGGRYFYVRRRRRRHLHATDSVLLNLCSYFSLEYKITHIFQV